MDNKLKKDLDAVCERMETVSNMLMRSGGPSESMQCLNMLINEIGMLKDLKEEIKGTSKDFREEKAFTLEELSNYDGTNGKPSYIAVNKIVYDMSSVPAWGGGTHFGIMAGKDLTAEFSSCHSQDILSTLTKVGVIRP